MRASASGSVIRLIAGCLWLCGLVQAAMPPLPASPARHFNDYSGVVDAGTAQRLDARLADFERETSNQFVVAIYPKLPEGTFLEEYTVKTAQSWGVGGKQKDNGVVLFVFIADRKMRIEVGYGLEGVLPDGLCGTIIANEIRPSFKAGNFADGMAKGIEAVVKASKNEYVGTGKTLGDAKSAGKTHLGFWLIVIVLLLIWFHLGDTVFQRGGRFIFWNLLDLVRLALLTGGNSRGGSGGGWSGGGGGGGFSGGGGSFGGGGASGDW